LNRKEYQIKQDNNNNKLFNQNTTIHGKSYSNIIESVKFYENAIQSLQAQIDQAEEMVSTNPSQTQELSDIFYKLRDLNSEKEKLNNLCSELNELYEQVRIR
jgi:prefoldin subunit 5